MSPTSYDVFLSYASQDRDVVARLAAALEGLGLRVWFDQTVLVPGVPWQRELVEGVTQSASTAVCIGHSEMGRWQLAEMETAIEQQQVEGSHRVIPVVLPGVDSNTVKLPPLLKRNTWVLLSDRLEDSEVLDRLYWGVTGQKRVPGPSLAIETRRGCADDATRAVDDAVESLIETLRMDNVTYFVGSCATPDDTAPLPLPFEITRSLLLELQLIDSAYDSLLPPVDIAGSYYAARSGSTLLEHHVIEMMADRSTGVPRTQRHLADLIAALSHRPKPRVRGRRQQQLIVTTNLDVTIERALLQKGIPFVRIVQHTSVPRIEINRYDNFAVRPDGSIQLTGQPGSTVAANDWEGLDEIISNMNRTAVSGSDASRSNDLHQLAVKDLAGSYPILYKFRGSQDVKGSCALSVDQYLSYGQSLARHNFVPAQVTELLNSGPTLLLGYGFFDPDFRLIYHGLLRAVELPHGGVYSVQLPPEQEQHDPYRRMETLLWDHMKQAALREWKITTVEALSEHFLARLTEVARRQFAA